MPSIIRRDMGIMDISIMTPKIGKPSILFTPDIRQLTTYTPKTRKRANTKRRRPKARETTPSLIQARL